MRPEIQKWLDAEQQILQASRKADELLTTAKAVQPPAMIAVRPATADDIKKGQLLWYLDDECYWQVVWSVLNPNDLFKAYAAHDGCRYGLEGAYVEIDAPDIEAERARFELWICAFPFDKCVDRIPDDACHEWPGAYRSIDVDLAWQAWQAATKAG